MVSPVIYRPNLVKHNGPRISTQVLWLHSAECPLRGGYAISLTDNVNNTPAWIASWHRFVDPIARVRQVPDHLAAWTQGYGNPYGIGWEQAGYAGFTREQWQTPEGLKQFENLAYDMAEVAKEHGIPPRWLTTDEVQAIVFGGDRTTKGLAIHAQIANDRTDPGPNFPYPELITRIGQINGQRPPAVIVPPTTTPAPPKKEWYEMALDNQTKKDLYEAVWFGAPGADLIPRIFEKGGEWPATTLGALTDRIIRQRLIPMQREIEQANAIATQALQALAAVAKGETLDVAKLEAGVREAARQGSLQGTKEGIDSIDVTVNRPAEG